MDFYGRWVYVAQKLKDAKPARGKGHCWGDYSDFGWTMCHACMCYNSGEGEVPGDEPCPASGICQYKKCKQHRRQRIMKAVRIWLGILLVVPAIVIWAIGLLLISLASVIAGEPAWHESARGRGAKARQWKDT